MSDRLFISARVASYVVIRLNLQGDRAGSPFAARGQSQEEFDSSSMMAARCISHPNFQASRRARKSAIAQPSASSGSVVGAKGFEARCAPPALAQAPASWRSISSEMLAWPNPLLDVSRRLYPNRAYSRQSIIREYRCARERRQLSTRHEQRAINVSS